MTDFASPVAPRPWVVFDLETAPLPNAVEFLELIPDAVPDDSPIEADRRLTDPVKIAADLEKKRLARIEQDREAQEKVEQQRATRLERASLDWNVGRIVAVGLQTESMDAPQTAIAEDEKREREILFWLWETLSARRPVVGFRIRSFDVPYAIQRSRLLRLVPPRISLARWENHDLCDLFDLLTFSDTQDTKVMRHTLARFAQRFGVQHDASISGADIPTLVAAGEWDQVRAHVHADVETTVALAEQLGVIRREQRTAAVA